MPGSRRVDCGPQDDAATRLRLAREAAVLSALGIGRPLILRCSASALTHGSTIEDALLASGAVDEEAYFGGLARLLRLPFLGEIDPASVIVTATIDSQICLPRMLRLAQGARQPLMAICPEAQRIDFLEEQLAAMPALRSQLVVTSRSTLKKAVWTAAASRRMAKAVNGLFEVAPEQSARIVVTGNQGFGLGVAVGLLAGGAVALPGPLLAVLHAALSITYFGGLLLRSAALITPRAPTAGLAPLAALGPLPVYSVLVALYREAEVVPQLIGALEQINWPRSHLDIKLVCEADDPDTIAAIEAMRPRSHIEVVRVPHALPRTKPKALNYALAGARGEFVVIYDAEDRPHPDQLREAHQRFRAGSPALACLQAPLVVANIGHSSLTAMFALEYAGLFRRMLPFLARHDLPLPLGGTSNHFRRAALEAVGGWDPYNVTEDADLGLRLYRNGYSIGMLGRPTLEDAPTRAGVWFGQRTRWLKGWVQTWLVLTRGPKIAINRGGIAARLVLYFLITGMLISALGHPFLFVFIGLFAAAALQTPSETFALGHALLILDLVNIFGSYALFVAIGCAGMIAHERLQIGLRFLFVPAYWLMVSAAGWRALIELRFRPFFWRKTPHNARSTASRGPPKLVTRPRLPYFGRRIGQSLLALPIRMRGKAAPAE